jgi:hypothetical protein
MFPACRALLPDRNPYKVQSEERGTDDHVVKLPNKDPVIVSYDTTSLEEREFRFEEHDDCQQDYKTLIKLYAFGEEMKDRMFQVHVMEALRNRLCQLPDGERTADDRSLENAILIYETNPEGSPLRDFISDCYAVQGLPEGLGAGAGKYHLELLIDLVKALDWYKIHRKECTDMEEHFTSGWLWPYLHSQKWDDMYPDISSEARDGPRYASSTKTTTR